MRKTDISECSTVLMAARVADASSSRLVLHDCMRGSQPLPEIDRGILIAKTYEFVMYCSKRSSQIIITSGCRLKSRAIESKRVQVEAMKVATIVLDSVRHRDASGILSQSFLQCPQRSLNRVMRIHACMGMSTLP